jgi:hypothetical protein
LGKESKASPGVPDLDALRGGLVGHGRDGPPALLPAHEGELAGVEARAVVGVDEVDAGELILDDHPAGLQLRGGEAMLDLEGVGVPGLADHGRLRGTSPVSTTCSGRVCAPARLATANTQYPHESRHDARLADLFINRLDWGPAHPVTAKTNYPHESQLTLHYCNIAFFHCCIVALLHCCIVALLHIMQPSHHPI